jgi:hypothetical protein
MRLFTSSCVFQAVHSKVTILVIALSIVLSACTENRSPTATTLEPIATETTLEGCAIENAIQVEPEDLREELNNYVGQCIGIRETVGKPVGTHAFLLTEYQLFGSKTILVFNASGTSFTIPPDRLTEAVLVTGEVRQFSIAEFERDYGIELDPHYANYENLPVIVAQSIVLSPDPDEVTENPDAFDNQVIAVAGEMDDRFAANIFTLDEEQLIGGEDLLVIATTTVPSFEEDDEDILAVGVLRRFNAETLEQEYNLNWNAEVRQQINAEFTNKFVLVAEAVYRAAD